MENKLHFMNQNFNMLKIWNARPQKVRKFKMKKMCTGTLSLSGKKKMLKPQRSKMRKCLNDRKPNHTTSFVPASTDTRKVPVMSNLHSTRFGMDY